MTEQNTPQMTHDEMIYLLKGMVFGTFDRTTPEERVALNMAIETLEQEPKTGHWIDNYNGIISCSNCRTWFYKDGRYSYMRYCPNCGCRMFEPQESEGV